MGKVIFSIKYEINPEKREEYLAIVRELKNLTKSETLADYRVFELKNKKNTFEEVYFFDDYEAYENWDDVQSERVEILMNKLSEIIKEQTTDYVTRYEV